MGGRLLFHFTYHPFAHFFTLPPSLPPSLPSRPEEKIKGLPRIIAESVGRDINDIYRQNNMGNVSAWEGRKEWKGGGLEVNPTDPSLPSFLPPS